MSFFKKLKLLTSPRYLTRRLIIRFMMDELSDQEFGTVVDVGAGKSPYRKLIRCQKYLATDFEPTLPEVVVADAADLPFEDETANLVVMTEVLEHLPEPQKALAEAARILKPGGLLALTTPFLWRLHSEPYDFYRYTEHGLRYLLKSNGFEILKLTSRGPNQLYVFCQLINMFLGKKIFLPLVFIFNAMGFILEKLSEGQKIKLPLGYSVLAKKKEG